MNIQEPWLSLPNGAVARGRLVVEIRDHADFDGVVATMSSATARVWRVRITTVNLRFAAGVMTDLPGV